MATVSRKKVARKKATKKKATRKKATKKKATRKKAASRATVGMVVKTYTASSLAFPPVTRITRSADRFMGDYVERLSGSLISAGNGRVVYKADCGSVYEFTSDTKQAQQMIDFLQTCL